MNDSKLEISAELKRRINERCEDSVESLIIASEKENQMLTFLQQEKYGNYHIYLYVFDQKRKIKTYEVAMKNLMNRISLLRTFFLSVESGKQIKVVTKREHFRIPIRDISHMPEQERVQFLKSAVTSEERKQYSIDQYMLHAQVLQFDNNKYVFMLSIASMLENAIPGRKLFQKIIQENESEPRKEREINLPDETVNYWKERFSDTFNMNAAFTKDPLLLKKQGRRQAFQTLILPKDIQRKIQEFENRNEIPLQSIMMLAYGVIFCKYIQTDKILVGLQRNDRRLDIEPIELRKNGELFQLCEDIQKQIRLCEAHDNLTFLQLTHLLSWNPVEYLPIRFQFTELMEINELLETKDSSTIRELHLDNNQGAVLTIKCNLFHEEKCIQYMYQEEVFKSGAFHDITLEHLHYIFYTMLGKMLDMASVNDIEVTGEELQNQDVAQRIEKEQLDTKIYSLKNSFLFTVFNEKELRTIAKQCNSISLLDQDYVLRNHQPTDYIYLITDGYVEENRIGQDGYIKTVQVLKTGDYLGLEALQKDMNVKSDYQVFGVHTDMLQIPVEAIYDMIKEHPEITWNLFRKYQNELNKFKNLWLLN